MFDKLMLSWTMAGCIIYIIQQATFSAVILKAGVLLDSFGMYWLCRQMMRDWDDFFVIVKIFAFFAIITAPLIVMEKFQGYSIFSLFGPVAAGFYGGRFRAAGSFPHSIILSCFWASLLPFFYARIKADKNTFLYWVAIIAVLSNVYFSASSTPLMTIGAIIIFWNLYSYRIYGKTILWSTGCALLLLHLIMKAPVWHLISRANIFSGSTGWHRYFLFDNFINHFSEWLFIGTKSTEHWGHAQLDITNQFILEGIRGGIITLFLFILILYYSIKIPGRYSLSIVTDDVRWCCWGLCAAMFGHIVTFWGVSYFGQINMLLIFMLAVVGFVMEKSRGVEALKTSNNNTKKGM
jgi:hypothetical protein